MNGGLNASVDPQQPSAVDLTTADRPQGTDDTTWMGDAVPEDVFPSPDSPAVSLTATASPSRTVVMSVVINRSPQRSSSVASTPSARARSTSMKARSTNNTAIAPANKKTKQQQVAKEEVVEDDDDDKEEKEASVRRTNRKSLAGGKHKSSSSGLAKINGTNAKKKPLAETSTNISDFFQPAARNCK